MPLLMDPGKEGTTEKERFWAMMAHASSMGYMFFPAFLPLGNLIGPLIIWGWKGRKTPYLRVQAARAVNFAIPMAVFYFIVMLIDGGYIVEAGRGGTFFVYMVGGFHILMTLCACQMALDGRYWRYPIQIPIIREQAKGA